MKRLKQNEVGISSVNYEVLSVHNLFTLNDRSRLLMKFKNIHEIDFDQNIEDAVNGKNYRLAVRLLYLKSLKRLSDSGLIDWQINKTNSVYVNELNHPTKKTEFLKLTHQFEYIWYGEYFLERPGYQHIESSFKEFMKKI